MRYQLSDNEFFILVSCMNQLDLITDLCSNISGSPSITADGLQSFLYAQQEALHAAIKAVEERHEAQTVLDREHGAMQYFDWAYALRIARGDALHTPNGAEERITERLAKTAQIDDSMQLVLNEWLAILTAAQVPTAAAPKAPKAPKAPDKHRKREKLTANA